MELVHSHTSAYSKKTEFLAVPMTSYLPGPVFVRVYDLGKTPMKNELFDDILISNNF